MRATRIQLTHAPAVRAVAMLAAFIGVISCQKGPPDTRATTVWVARSTGAGAVHAGMPLSEASRLLGELLEADYTIIAECAFVIPKSAPPGLSLMIRNDTVARVDIDSTTVATDRGARVGDSEARVLGLYHGVVRVAPHPYATPAMPNARYLIVDSPDDSLHRLLFETDGHRVISFRTGHRAAVDLIEGCA
jgi:hypothetical protein